MDPATATAADIMAATIRDALAAFGLLWDPANKYRWKRVYDTQTIQNAGTIQTFFNTSTSSIGAHARGRAGCNLRERGSLDDRTDFLLCAIGVVYLGLNGGTAALGNDVALVNDYGIVDRVWVGGTPVMDDPIPVAACAMDEGFTVPAIGMPSAALDFDAITNGAAGGPRMGYVLQPFARPYITGGQDLQVDVVQHSAANLSAALMLRVSLIGIEITPRNGGN